MLPGLRPHHLRALGCASALVAAFLPLSAAAPGARAATIPLISAAAIAASQELVPPQADTVPHWSGSSAAADGTRYTYTMVGTDPARGSATTVIPTEIIPLRVVFSNGAVMDGSSRVQTVLASPLFLPAPFARGATQYGDAMLRAQNWSAVSTTGADWHVLLAPRVLPTQTIVVPAAIGYEFVGTFGSYGGMTPPPDIQNAPIGLLDEPWLYHQLQGLTDSLHLDPRTLPIFLADNTGLTYKKTPSLDGTMGEHGTFTASTNGDGGQPVQTFIYASYDTPHIYPAALDGIQDITVLSHEVEEWMNDPFLQNSTPAWTAPIYGCNALLEVGDPALALSIPVTMPDGTTYHPQDEVFLPWYLRTGPSGFNSAYDYLGAYTTPAPSC